jgi:xanthine dehydrogenase YagS FAD-binding subunit
MKNFAFVRANSLKVALASLGSNWNEAAVMSGGTDLIGEMKDYIQSPDKVVNLKAIKDLKYIRNGDNTLKIGALSTISSIESDPVVVDTFTALSKAAGLVASPQLRNMGTIGGNVCQRPRCWYYRDAEVNCLRKGGPRCYSIAGENKYHAILGGFRCYIVHPSDVSVALMAFDADVKIASAQREKTVNINDFFVLPDVNPNRENILNPGEIVTEFELPVPDRGTKSTFIKIQEREVWDFAVASVAVSMTLDGNVCKKARIVLGAAAPTPWRSRQAEEELEGTAITERVASAAAEASVYGSKPMTKNGYKVQLFKNIVKRAILELV